MWQISQDVENIDLIFGGKLSSLPETDFCNGRDLYLVRMLERYQSPRYNLNYTLKGRNKE